MSSETLETPAMISPNKLKMGLLMLMALQNSSTVLVGRATRSGKPKEEMFEVKHFILVAELVKLLLSMILESATSNVSLIHSLNVNVISNPLDFLKISIPALLYLVQNTVLYVALSNLSAPMFQVCYQTKLLTTAIVSVFLLGRHYTFQQWLCLTTLGMGVAGVVLSSKETTEAETTGGESLSTGLIAVTVACLSSAFAGVYFEKVIKVPGAQTPSVWMRNVQLAFFSVLIALGQNLFKPSQVEFMHGFDATVWVLVFLQAGGGLLVAAVIKYADNVLKGMATGCSVVLSTGISVMFFGVDLTKEFSGGALLILASVYVFSNKIECGKQKGLGQEEGVQLLPK